MRHLGFQPTPVHERSKHGTSAEQHESFTIWAYWPPCWKDLLSVASKSGAVWHINVPKCCREVEIIARLETPPLLFVCWSRDAATGLVPEGASLHGWLIAIMRAHERDYLFAHNESRLTCTLGLDLKKNVMWRKNISPPPAKKKRKKSSK